MLEEHKEYIKPKRLAAAAIIISLFAVMLVATPQAKGAQFYIASWDYPDAYDQGIHDIRVMSNRTGSWVTFQQVDYDSADNVVDWNASQAVQIGVWGIVNASLLGLTYDDNDDIETGKNYIRHNVTVTDQFGTEVYSQQNFTYASNITGVEYEGLIWYFYTAILGFSPLEGELYTITVTFEVYW